MAKKPVDEIQAQRALDMIPDQEIYLRLEEPWAAKPLDLEGTLRLFQVAGDLFVGIGSDPDVSKVSSLFGRIDKGTILILLELITQQPREWLEENYNFRKAIKVVVDFWRINELGAMLGELGWEGLGKLAASETPAEEEQTELPTRDGSVS